MYRILRTEMKNRNYSTIVVYWAWGNYIRFFVTLYFEHQHTWNLNTETWFNQVELYSEPEKNQTKQKSSPKST